MSFADRIPSRAAPLPRPAAYLLAAAVIGLALFASGTPSPLYGTYAQLWGFSSLVLTLVYATYAFGVLASLILAGRLSDEVGRRPVLIVAARHPRGGHGPLHGRRLGRLALRRPRHPGPGDRPRPERRRGRPARPPPRPRPGRRRPHQRRRLDDRDGQRRPPPRPRSSSTCPPRGSSPTSSCWSSSCRPGRHLAPARAGRGRPRRPLPPHPAAALRAAGRPPAVPAGVAGGALLVVARRPLPLARPASSRRSSSAPTTTWSPGSASSSWPGPPRSPSSPSAARCPGPAPPTARWRWPPGWR